MNNKEIKLFAETLCFTEEQAGDILEIFEKIYPKKTIQEYINEWEEHWHREENLQEFYKYEKENCISDYADTSIFDSIESFAECVKDTFYKLKHSEMVIVEG